MTSHSVRPLILIIEDNQDICTLYRAILGMRATVVIAETIEDARTKFAEHHDNIALIMMDGCVPGRDYNTGELVADFRRSFKGDIIATSITHRDQQMVDGCTISASGTYKIDAAKLALTLLNLPAIDKQAVIEHHFLPRGSGASEVSAPPVG